MTDKAEGPEWPRELWMAEREEHDQGVVTAVLSEHATVARWAGDKERDREFHHYIDADIHESAQRYHAARYEALSARLAEVDAVIEAATLEAYRLIGEGQGIRHRGAGPKREQYARGLVEAAKSIRAALSTDAKEQDDA